MTITQQSREAAERWHRFNNDYPELAERSLHEVIASAITANQNPKIKRLKRRIKTLEYLLT
jgi:hypothetical protein